jgi:hypothetical protein
VVVTEEAPSSVHPGPDVEFEISDAGVTALRDEADLTIF